jgi:hypothetical protein
MANSSPNGLGCIFPQGSGLHFRIADYTEHAYVA